MKYKIVKIIVIASPKEDATGLRRIVLNTVRLEEKLEREEA
ncbi:MAG: hypothetical protein AAF378_10975 [Cyanobacteria bacterium P01_A01_bin.84]